VGRPEETSLKRAGYACKEVVPHHGTERHGADALRHFSEKLAPSQIEEVVFDGMSHSFLGLKEFNRG
jgi:hypothetical protein